MDTSSARSPRRQDSLAEQVAASQNSAVEAFYLDPYLVGLIAARPCETTEELPPPGIAFA